MAVLVLLVTGNMKEQIQKVLIIIRTLNSMGTSRSSASETGLANTSYENEFLLQGIPVLGRNFFKEIVADGSLRKTKYYTIRVELQVRGTPHVRCIL